MKPHSQRSFAAALLILTALLLSGPVRSQASTTLAERAAELGLLNFLHPEASVMVSGQPTRDQLESLSQAGVKHIITLRPSGELGWDEAALVKKLGMQFHSIPVSGAAGVSFKNAATLSALLADLNGEPVLLHCASGNRVGALTALAWQQQGHSVEESLQRGREWGLSGLETMVRTRLDQQLLCCADEDKR